MAELADALDLGSSGLPVQVQVLSSAVSGLYGSLLGKGLYRLFFYGRGLWTDGCTLCPESNILSVKV